MTYHALLIVSFGGPERREDVMPFLENVLRGKNVPRERMLQVAEHYYHFGGRSPINDQNRALIAALECEFKTHGPSLPIYWGNRNWHPLLADTLRQMQAGNGWNWNSFGIIKTAFENGLVDHVYADETRPLLQGLRLTAFELEKNGIPFTMQTDSSAAELMKQGKVDLVITGADRIALNGGSANKIGTYNLAILANYHNIPFYIAAPSTTIDRTISTGNEIVIEYRSKKELFYFGEKLITPDHYDAFTPAFDVTPAHLISGIITEEGLFTFPYIFIR